MSRRGAINPVEDDCFTCYDLRLTLLTIKRKEPTQAWRIYRLRDEHRRLKHPSKLRVHAQHSSGTFSVDGFENKGEKGAFSLVNLTGKGVFSLND